MNSKRFTKLELQLAAAINNWALCDAIKDLVSDAEHSERMAQARASAVKILDDNNMLADIETKTLSEVSK